MSTTWQPDTDGVWLDLPAPEYHAAPGVSNSMLKHMDPPARFPVETKKKVKPTPWMRMGTLVHHARLEPDVPLPRIVVRPPTYPAPADHEKVKEGTIPAGHPLKWFGGAGYCKRWEKAQAEAGLEVLTEEEWDTFGNCVQALEQDEQCAAIFEDGLGEVSVFQEIRLPYSSARLRRKMRLDWVRPQFRYIADVKVVQKGMAKRENWETLAFDRRYIVQAPYYMDGWNSAVDEENKVDRFIFVVVEREAPFLTAKFEIGINSQEAAIGRSIYIQDLETLSECQSTGVWPGHPPGIQRMGIPAFARRKLNL